MKKRTRYQHLNDCSVSQLSQQIKSEIPYLVSKYSSKQSFIPFIRERDSLGKIIEKTDFPLNKARSLPKRRPKKKPLISSPRLLKKINYDTPAVGTYDTKSTWIKSTFSQKSFVFSPVSQKSPLLTRSSSASQNAKPLAFRRPFTYESAPRTTSTPQQRAKGFWENFKLYGTPENMKKVFNFNADIKNVLGFQLEITKSLEKLREIASANKFNFENLV